MLNVRNRRGWLFLLTAVLAVWMMISLCAGEENAAEETEDKDYTLQQVVVLSRHNIRSPLSEKGSMISEITPQEFFRKYVGWNLSDMVTVINAPTKDKPYGRTYTVRYLGNIRGGAYPVKYLNLPMDDLRDLTIRQLKDGRAVWFGSDVGQFSDRKGGYLTTDAYAVDELFSTEFPMTKEQRLDYGESLMTHAMVITGVDLDDEGRPIRWKVENSWGKDRGNDGFYVMSDEWFGEFSYQILLDRKYFTPEQAAAFDTEPIVLQPWDPMGSLATVEEQYGRSFRG